MIIFVQNLNLFLASNKNYIGTLYIYKDQVPEVDGHEGRGRLSQGHHDRVQQVYGFRLPRSKSSDVTIGNFREYLDDHLLTVLIRYVN